MKKLGEKGFTIIELMVVITIMGFMVMTVAIPYIFYQNKAKIRVTKKELSQILYEVRNMATNGYSTGSINQSLGVFFDIETNKNVITVIGLPYFSTGSDISPNNFYNIRTINLEPGMQIDSVGSRKKVLFLYSAVYGEGKYYTWNTAGIREELNGNEFPIVFSYKGAGTGSLQGSITYYPQTYIVDY